MMLARFVVFAVIILLFSGVAQAGNIIVEPTEYNIDLTGGDTSIVSVTITWTGETAIVGFIETNIMPDGDGINVTYSENPVILIPDTPKTVDMIINVAINIMPDEYIITTVVFTEIEEVIRYRGGGTTTIYKDKEILVENLTRINELLLIIQRLQDQINQTYNCTACQPLIDMLQNTIDELTALIEEGIPDEKPEPGHEPYDWRDVYPIFLIFTIIICILCCIICYKFWVLKSRTEKQETDKTKVSGDNENGSTDQ